MLYIIPNPLLPLLYKLLGHFAYVSFFASSVLAIDVDFRNQITLGSAIVATLIVTIAGIFTVRSKIANIWRQEAEGERAAKERAQEELAEAKASRAEFERSQQEIRHDLKNKNAELIAQLKVTEAKTDLSIALQSLQEIAIAQQSGHDETHRILSEIRDKLPTQPILVETVEGDKK